MSSSSASSWAPVWLMSRCRAARSALLSARLVMRVPTRTSPQAHKAVACLAWPCQRQISAQHMRQPWPPEVVVPTASLQTRSEGASSLLLRVISLSCFSCSTTHSHCSSPCQSCHNPQRHTEPWLVCCSQHCLQHHPFPQSTLRAVFQMDAFGQLKLHKPTHWESTRTRTVAQKQGFGQSRPFVWPKQSVGLTLWKISAITHTTQ